MAKKFVGEDIFPMSADLKPEILYREKARYTDEARKHGVEGAALLLVIFQVELRFGLRSV